MKLLLDTHIWLWMLADPARLSSRSLELVEDPETVLLLSAASSWEIAIKCALSKLKLPNRRLKRARRCGPLTSTMP